MENKPHEYIQTSKLISLTASLPNQAVADLFTSIWNQLPIGHTKPLRQDIKGKIRRPGRYPCALWCGWEGACSVYDVSSSDRLISEVSQSGA